MGSTPQGITTPISWSTGNTKLRKLGTVSFGIPAGFSGDGFDTCPSKGICAGYCYARRGFYKFPWVDQARERNLALAREDLDAFFAQACADLWRLQPRSVRVHDSGDFFSQAYLDTWYRIARELGGAIFYSYTKQFHALDVWARKPENFRLVQSYGGLHDDQVDLARPHARVFVDHAQRRAAGYVDGLENDLPAIRGDIRIGIVFHSDNKPLTPGQHAALRVMPPDADDQLAGVPSSTH